jgi:hypothetical protein
MSGNTSDLWRSKHARKGLPGAAEPAENAADQADRQHKAPSNGGQRKPKNVGDRPEDQGLAPKVRRGRQELVANMQDPREQAQNPNDRIARDNDRDAQDAHDETDNNVDRRNVNRGVVRAVRATGGGLIGTMSITL